MTSTKELRRLFLFLLIGAFVGLIINAFGWALFIALAGWTVIQAIQFNRLNAWAKRPLGKPPRITYGWFNTVMNPYKLIRRERNRAANAITGAKEVFGLIELLVWSETEPYVDAKAGSTFTFSGLRCSWG